MIAVFYLECVKTTEPKHPERIGVWFVIAGLWLHPSSGVRYGTVRLCSDN